MVSGVDVVPLGKIVTVRRKYCNRCMYINGIICIIYLIFCANTIVKYVIIYPWQYFKRSEGRVSDKREAVEMLLTFK